MGKDSARAKNGKSSSGKTGVVSIFAKPMADVETTGSDPDLITSWIGILITVTE